ncbi:MAG: TIGR00341 family protein [Pyrinomonadaceae bacterium]
MNKQETTEPNSDEVVKDTIREQINENAIANFSYIFMNVMATIIACYGLLANSTAVVIGAMLIAALLGPITGIALGLVDGNTKLLKTSFISEIIGVAVVLLTAFIIGSVHSHLPTGSEIAARTSPNIMDLFVALAGGAAGAYATTKPKISAGLIGVAISTALVPPLSTCAILVARGQYKLGFGGFLLFFANFAAIQFASSVVFWLSGYHNILTKARNNMRKIALQVAISLGVMMILTVLLGYNFYNMATKERFEQAVRDNLQAVIKEFPTTSLLDVKFQYDSEKTLVTAIVQTPKVVTPKQVSDVSKDLPSIHSKQTDLHIRSLITTETTATGNIEPNTDNNVDTQTQQQ